jgi:hypothetical protein
MLRLSASPLDDNKLILICACPSRLLKKALATGIVV